MAAKKSPSKLEQGRKALRDLTEEQLFDEIGKLPEYLAEMKRLESENEMLKRGIRQGGVLMDRLEAKLKGLEKKLEEAEAKLKNSIPAPVVEPKPGESDFATPAGLEGGPYNCRRCAGRVRLVITAKNRKKTVVCADGVRGQKVSHRMRNTFDCAWGFDAAGEYVTVRTDDKHSDPQAKVYEFHTCGDRR